MGDVRFLRTYCGELDYTPELITESKERNQGRIVLSGILQKADTLNQNGRIYPRDILEREVRNYQKFILENRATGELDHPAESTISLKNVCHKVVEAKMDGDTCYGKIEILNTPSGKIVQELMSANVKLGISSRGVGTTEAKGEYQVVCDDFQIICWDIVSDPSTVNAFMLPEATIRDGRLLTESDKRALEKFFTREDRIDRVLNDILMLRA